MDARNAARKGRPSLPVTLQNELWGRAAGRCEFRGCNELVYVDDLTQQRSNLSAISHIVAYSPAGPRGDPVRSELLARDLRNLILTCRKHGKIIDDLDKVAEYPEELLLEFKREHEERVRMLTGITEESQTHVLLVQAPIDGCDFAIDEKRAFRALLPKYPAEEKAHVIDLCGIALPATAEGFFPLMARSLSDQLAPLFRRWPGRPRIHTLSVFALAPVPLLVHLGFDIGDIHQVDLYQKHRRGENWTWGDDEPAEEFYEVYHPEHAGDGRDVAVVLSVSSRVDPAEVDAAVGRGMRLYEIRAVEPGLDFLSSRKRLEVFGYEFRKLLAHLREAERDADTVHLIAAVPAPVAIEVGRSIKGFHPDFQVYEYDKVRRNYFPALNVNPRRNVRDD